MDTICQPHYSSNMATPDIERPYKCQIDLALPTATHAQHLRDVLSVDGELGNKIVKFFSVERASKEGDGSGRDDGCDGNDELRVLRM